MVHLPSRMRLADGVSVVNEGELHQLVPLLHGGGVPCRRGHGPCIPLDRRVSLGAPLGYCRLSATGEVNYNQCNLGNCLISDRCNNSPIIDGNK